MFFLLQIAYYFAMVLIFGNVIMSWIPSLRQTPIGAWVYDAGERILEPIRHVIPSISLGNGGGIDLSPLVAYAMVRICYSLLLSLFSSLGTI
ncbi:MAG TPA: YggT family protein [Armatimonadota bacterium]|nr:YggT family protein [Armatimonadota bacterium]